MNTPKPKPDLAFHKTPVATDAQRKDAERISTALIKSTSLTVVDEPDGGCDPYNSTGQHVILQARLARKP